MVGAFPKPEVMNTVVGTWDYQMLTAGKRRKGSRFCQNGFSLSGEKEMGCQGKTLLWRALLGAAPSPCPRAVCCRSWPVARSCWPSCQGLLARRRWLVAQGPGRPAGTETPDEWIFSVPGTTLKGRSVTRWSRGRHLSNKHCLHKITAWVIAFLSSLCTKPSGK